MTSETGLAGSEQTGSDRVKKGSCLQTHPRRNSDNIPSLLPGEMFSVLTISPGHSRVPRTRFVVFRRAYKRSKGGEQNGTVPGVTRAEAFQREI